MGRWIKVYDRETRELIDKEEFDRRRAESAKPFRGELPRRAARGRWGYNKVTRRFYRLREQRKRTAVTAAVITDEIGPTVSHATEEGLVFTSKAKLRAHYRQHGMIERGGEFRDAPPPPKPSKEQIKDDVSRALNDLRWGNVPQTEWEKEICLREQRELEKYKRNH